MGHAQTFTTHDYHLERHRSAHDYDRLVLPLAVPARHHFHGNLRGWIGRHAAVIGSRLARFLVSLKNIVTPSSILELSIKGRRISHSAEQMELSVLPKHGATPFARRQRYATHFEPCRIGTPFADMSATRSFCRVATKVVSHGDNSAVPYWRRCRRYFGRRTGIDTPTRGRIG